MTRVPNVGVGREDSTFKERQDLRAAVLEAPHLLPLADIIAHLHVQYDGGDVVHTCVVVV